MIEKLRQMFLATEGVTQVNVPDNGTWGELSSQWTEWKAEVSQHLPDFTGFDIFKFHQQIEELQDNICRKQVFEAANYNALQVTKDFVTLNVTNINKILGSKYTDEI